MRSIALALFIFGTIPFILQRPFVGLLVWSWLGYMNPHRLTFGFAYDFPWVYLIAVVTLVALAISKESKRIPKSSISILLFVFLAWTGITTIFAAMPGAAWEKWQEFAKTLAMVFVTLMLVRDRKRLDALLWVIVVSLGFYGVKGGIFTLVKGGHAHVFGPPGSFITDNNAFALALCMTLPLMRYLQLHATHRWLRWALGASMLLSGIAVLGTYSRGGLIGLAVVAVALLAKSRRRVAILLTSLVIVVAAYHFMPPTWTARMDTLHDARQTDSGETRIQSWKFATNVALHQPILGGGFEVYSSRSLWLAYAPEGSVQRAIHSIYFRTLGEQGFPGLALFACLLLASWRNCHKVRKRAGRDPAWRWAADLASMLQVCLIAFATAGALLPMPYFDLTYQLMALTAVLATLQLRSAAAPDGDDPHSAAALPRSVADQRHAPA